MRLSAWFNQVKQGVWIVDGENQHPGVLVPTFVHPRETGGQRKTKGSKSQWGRRGCGKFWEREKRGGGTGRQMFSKGEGRSSLGLPGHREEEWPWVHLPVNADFVNLPHYFSVTLISFL